MMNEAIQGILACKHHCGYMIFLSYTQKPVKESILFFGSKVVQLSKENWPCEDISMVKFCTK